MANIRVKQALEKLDAEINRVGNHVAQYSGVDGLDARAIERTATDICETAAQIVQLAQEAQGVRSPDLRRKVRAALGFTTP